MEDRYRLNYRPPMSNTASTDQLRMELFRLRKSTRRALLQSWDRAESLRKECDINTKVIVQHEDVIVEMRKKEKGWQRCCLIAEAKLQEKSKEIDSSRCHKMLSSSQCKQSVEDQNDEGKLQEIPEQRDSSQYNKILSFCQNVRLLAGQNDDQNKLEFVLKISSRDEAISSLEQTLDETIKSTQDLQAEIQSLAVTQRIKEREIYDSYAQKEEIFKGQIESLRKELSKAMLKSEA